MKKLLLLSLLLCGFLQTWADTWTDSEGVTWSYWLSSGKATIAGSSKTSGSLVIPSVVNGYIVTSIDQEAFLDYSGLTSVIIPESVTYIGWWAFSGCTGLISVTIPGSVTGIGGEAFYGCSSLTSVIIPEGMTSIGERVFCNCSGLTSVTIPSSLKNIDHGAFDGCSNLSKVIIPDIAAWCNINFVSMVYDGGEEGSMPQSNPLQYAHHIYSDENTEITDLVIPEGVTTIKPYAFYSCYGVSSVTIPESVTSIGEEAFNDCVGLNIVTMNSDAIMSSNYTAYDDMVGDIWAVNTLWTIFGEQVKQYIIGEGVTHIGDGVFGDCYEMTTVIIPSSVSSIGSYAFVGCSGLTSVTIPEGVTNIGDHAFDYCSSLTSVYCNIDTPLSISANTFSNRANATLYVPYGTKLAYQTARYWKQFKNIIEMESSAISIEEIMLNETDLEIAVGETATLTASILPLDATHQELEWVSSDDTVATVDNGVVTAVRAGTATITVTATDGSGVSASCQVTVTASSEADTDYSLIDNTVYLEHVQGVAGGQRVISVKMKNTVPIQGFMFSLVLPEGVSVATDADGLPMAELSEERTIARKTDQFGSNITADGNLRVVCSSTHAFTFDGNDGEVARITINLASDMVIGDYAVLLKDVSLSDANNVSYRTDHLKSTLSVVECTLGDVNGDMEVDVADFTLMANYLLGKSPKVFVLDAADVAGSTTGGPDGYVDIADLTGIANIILHSNGGSSGAPRRTAATPTDIDTQENAIYVEPLTAMPGTQQVLSVRMKNNVDVSGMEFTLKLPEGITIATDADGIVMAGLSNERTTAYKTDFFAGSLLGDGLLKVLCVSTKENPGTGKMFTFDGNEGAVAHITVNIPADYEEGTYTVSVTNAKTSDPDGVKNTLADTSTCLTIGSATGISHTSDLSPETSGDYYTLDGQKLEKKPAKKGVYIHNGIKVVVK